ncbi:MAG TPA: choice-of-anchor D domain-containing protein [Anaerolineae bacterium]|nr:choice-of-anchor D domain-containing protein [Anaerolineae bacterium]
MRKLTRLLIAWVVVVTLLVSAADSTALPVVFPATQWVTPLELDFGPVGLGTASPTLKVTITNSGDTPLTGWAGGAVPAPFNASQDCNISGGVLPGHSCHYFFTFSPTVAGVFTATSSSSTNVGPIHIIVHGTGVGAQATYYFRSLDFGNIFTNGTMPGVAATQVVTITNTGLAPLTGWAGGAVPSPFNASQDCNIAGGVLPGHSCHYFFGFSTSTAGTYSATSTSSTNGGDWKTSRSTLGRPSPFRRRSLLNAVVSNPFHPLEFGMNGVVQSFVGGD